MRGIWKRSDSDDEGQDSDNDGDSVELRMDKAEKGRRANFE